MGFRRLMATALVLMGSVVIAQTARPRQGATTRPSEGVVVYSPGSSSCGAWLEAREGAKTDRSDFRHLQFEAFLSGFASAYNWYVGDVTSAKGVIGEMDAAGQWAYMDKYCRDNPTHAFAAAVSNLLDHLKSLQR